MFGIELDWIKKTEIAFCALFLLTAAFFAYRGMQPQPDLNVTAWVEEFKIPVNDKIPLSATNPIDPNRSRVVTTFANTSGRLEITEYPGLSLKPLVKYRLDSRRDAASTFKTQWSRVENISDPARRAIAFAAFLAADGRPQNLLYRAGLEHDQRTKARDLYKSLTDAVVLIDEDAKQGVVEPALQDKLVAALEDYRKYEGDIAHDPKKAALAAAVMKAGKQFSDKLIEKRNEAVGSYVEQTYTLLTDEQRKKIATVGEELASQAVPRRAGKTAG